MARFEAPTRAGSLSMRAESYLTTGQEDLTSLYCRSQLWKPTEHDKEHLATLGIISNSLFKFGLSKNEIKVFLYLTRFGMQKAQCISDGLSLHRTETYKLLRRLEKMGLMFCVFGKPLKFVALPFEKALTNLVNIRKQGICSLERMKDELINMWVSLPQPVKSPKIRETFQILEGKKQIDVKIIEVVEHAKKEVLVVAPETDILRLFRSGALDKLGKISKEVRVRLLTDYSVKSSYVIKKIKLTQVNFSYLSINDPPSFILSDVEQLLFSLRKNGSARGKLCAFWTNYEEFVGAFRILFSKLWKENTLEESKLIRALEIEPKVRVLSV